MQPEPDLTAVADWRAGVGDRFHLDIASQPVRYSIAAAMARRHESGPDDDQHPPPKDWPRLSCGIVQISTPDDRRIRHHEAPAPEPLRPRRAARTTPLGVNIAVSITAYLAATFANGAQRRQEVPLDFYMHGAPNREYVWLTEAYSAAVGPRLAGAPRLNELVYAMTFGEPHCALAGRTHAPELSEHIYQAFRDPDGRRSEDGLYRTRCRELCREFYQERCADLCREHCREWRDPAPDAADALFIAELRGLCERHAPLSAPTSATATKPETSRPPPARYAAVHCHPVAAASAAARHAGVPYAHADTLGLAIAQLTDSAARAAAAGYAVGDALYAGSGSPPAQG